MILPGVDEVLCQADAGRWASDGDLAIGWSIHWICNLDLGTRHLPDLVDLGPLAANDAPNKLQWRKAEKQAIVTFKINNEEWKHAIL